MLPDIGDFEEEVTLLKRRGGGGSNVTGSQLGVQQSGLPSPWAHEEVLASLEEDGESGHVRVNFVPKVAGTHSIRVLVGAHEIGGSPFAARFAAGALDPAQCTARGGGLQAASAGRGSSVDIFSHDCHGNALSVGEGACFEASVSTSDGRVVECTSRCLDRDDGSYRLVYTTFTAGADLRLSISCRGASIRGSPFDIRVTPGRAYAARTYVVGPGATYAPLAPSLAKFTVHCVDRWSNPCLRGGEKLSVRSNGPSHPITTVRDLEDGAYEVSCRYGLSGVYQLSVCVVDGERRAPVIGSPFTVYAGLQLAEQYLMRWCVDTPRSLPALAADATGGKAWAGGSSNLAVARFGVWRYDREALLAQSLRAWKLFVGRTILERMVAGIVPPGSPRLIASRSAPSSAAVPVNAKPSPKPMANVQVMKIGRGGVSLSARMRTPRGPRPGVPRNAEVKRA